eukprot:228448_1
MVLKMDTSIKQTTPLYTGASTNYRYIGESHVSNPILKSLIENGIIKDFFCFFRFKVASPPKFEGIDPKLIRGLYEFAISMKNKTLLMTKEGVQEKAGFDKSKIGKLWYEYKDLQNEFGKFCNGPLWDAMVMYIKYKFLECERCLIKWDKLEMKKSTLTCIDGYCATCSVFEHAKNKKHTKHTYYYAHPVTQANCSPQLRICKMPKSVVIGSEFEFEIHLNPPPSVHKPNKYNEIKLVVLDENDIEDNTIKLPNNIHLNTRGIATIKMRFLGVGRRKYKFKASIDCNEKK